MSPKRIFLLGAAAMLLYLAFPYALRLAWPRTTVGYATAVRGRITGSWQSRHVYAFFLDDQNIHSYDFSAFAPAPTATGTSSGGPMTVERAAGLNRYLRRGDYLRKSARSPVLTVQRGDSLSRWVCAAAEALP